jgi:hypothetical protein
MGDGVCDGGGASWMFSGASGGVEGVGEDEAGGGLGLPCPGAEGRILARAEARYMM